MSDAAWQPLLTELDHWRDEGRALELWLRDDDAMAPGLQLDRLVALVERFAIPVLLAVVPFLASTGLARYLRYVSLILPCQHGAWHRNHASPREKKAEFGAHRPGDLMRDEVAAGRQRLIDLFGLKLAPVFVPPWNRIDQALALSLPKLGLTGLSCFRDFQVPGAMGLVVANPQIDLMDWHGGRVGRSAADISSEIASVLSEVRRAGLFDFRLGLVLHHRDHDEVAWSVLRQLLDVLCLHPTVTTLDPRRLFLPANTG